MVRRGQNKVTRQISLTTRKALVEALRLRYRSAAFGDRIKILDEFVALTGYHRKHAIRVLREEIATAQAARTRNRIYDEAVRQTLDRYQLALDAIRRVPRLADQVEAVTALHGTTMQRHKLYIGEHGDDMPELRDWRWTV